jgi:tetratricopeptide (TPR) repeat protein
VIGILSITSLSYTIDPLFAVIIEDKHENGKLYYIGSQNSNDSNTLNYTNRGDELFEEGKYEEAITYYDKALAVDPDDTYTLNSKGLALENLDKYEDAITSYDKILRIDPNDLAALYNKGTSLENLGRHEEAITFFDKALAAEPNDLDTLNWKGYSLYNLGKYDDAITYFDKVLEIDSKNDYARNLKELSLTHSPHSIDSYFLTSTADVADNDPSNTTQSNSNSFRDSKTKVSFQYPSDWEIASDEYIESSYGDSEGFIVAMFPKSLDGSSISVIYEELPFSMSAKEYVNIIEKSFQEEKDTSMSKPVPISIGSLDGYKYNVTTADETLPDVEFVTTQVVFVKNSKAFAITYLLGAEMAKHLEDIESMLDSFEINNSNKDNDNTEDDNKAQALNEEELENAKEKGKAVLSNIFNSLFPQTGEKYGNSVYGVDIAFPKNWTGFEMKIVFPMAIVSPEGFNIRGIFSKYADSMVDKLAETMLSSDGKELSEQELRELFEPKVQESVQVLTEDVIKYMENKTVGMGVFIYDKEFARLVNSIDPNNTKSDDSLTSIYEQLAASDPIVKCERETLEYITLNNNISAEMSTEQCSYTDSNKKENNLNYFVLTPNAIIGVQYASDADKENEKFRAEFDEALRTLSVEESLPINNQTIQQFLSG